MPATSLGTGPFLTLGQLQFLQHRFNKVLEASLDILVYNDITVSHRFISWAFVKSISTLTTFQSCFVGLRSGDSGGYLDTVNPLSV